MKPDVDVAIVGAGFGGLGMAIKLREEGRRSFVVFEKEVEPGGTWYVNTYPGCACDVPSHLYSFSFEPNPNWSRSYSRQHEIWRYLKHCAAKYGIERSLRLGTAVTSLRYDESARLWHVTAGGGEALTARAVVAATGALSVPDVPRIDGVESFRGHSFHSQTWDHDYDLRGKRVAVVGTGASAIQFVPQIAPDVASLHLFQRSPPWILPKWDRHIGRRGQRLFRSLPLAQRINRVGLYWYLESRAIAFARWHWLLRAFGGVARWHMRRQVPDAELRRMLTPDYALGCKRVLLSNDYYPALNRPNVHLIDQPVARVDETGVTAADGRRVEVDAIIFGTGFRASDPFERGFVVGRDDADILDAWEGGPEAYLGTLISGFPNLFLLAGPNTGLGHSSMIYMLESQIGYVMDAMRLLDEAGAASLDVRPATQRQYNARLQARLARSIWQQGGCTSWYQTRGGRNVALWPGFTWQFRRRTRRVRRADVELDTEERSSTAEAKEQT